MPDQYIPQFELSSAQDGTDEVTTSLHNDAYNTGDTQLCSFRPGAMFRHAAMFRPMQGGGCSGGQCFAPTQPGYAAIQNARQQPQGQVWQQVMQVLGPILREMRETIRALRDLITRHLGPGGTDAQPPRVTARPDIPLGNGLTLHSYSNNDYYIDNAAHQITRAKIGQDTYEAVPGQPNRWCLSGQLIAG
jgi:hypothetical protein